MGTSHSKSNKSLVYGYVRRYEKTIDYYVPESISVLVLTYYPECQIYAVGRNGKAEFGMGNYEKLTSFRLLAHMSSYCDDPSNIHTGDHRFIVHNIHSELYCAGQNTNFDCGQSGPDMQKSLEKVKEVKLKPDFSQFITVVSDGVCARHTFVAFNDNTLHAFGWNQYGQFGNGKQNAYSPFYRTKLRVEWNIKQIACGQTHSLFLTTLGNVYSTGMNDHGQCGLKLDSHLAYNLNCFLELIPVPTLFDIESIASGQTHSLALDKHGKVWIFGSNEHGQLGLANEDLDNTAIFAPVVQPALLEQKSSIGIIRCGAQHSLFIDTQKCEAFLCGSNIHGQIGNNKKDVSQIYAPCLFRFEGYTNKIIDGALGVRHSVLITEGREILLTFGSNKFRQCAPSSPAEYVFDPYVLTKSEIGIKDKKESISRVVCGNDTTIVATHGV